jgi:pSer/pThr/pTyr-binding forkhead associated (FHA) protein
MQAISDASPHGPSSATGAPSQLVVSVGSSTYSFEESDAPVVIGREAPADVIIDDPHISRIHMRIDHTTAGWVAVDQSRNGIFVKGVRQSTIPIAHGLVINLESRGGTAVTFSVRAATPEDADDGDDDSDTETTRPDVARVGAAVAARRDELGLTQRALARDRVINAGALIAFEKGRRWPRKTTRAKLEEKLQWPPGRIAELRHEVSDAATTRVDVGNSNTVRTSLLTGAVEVALTRIKDSATELPDPSSAAFSARAATLLADLRRLESVASNAARDTKGTPDVALTLGAIRKCYKDLMLRAARSPGATLGQRLYAARQRGELTVEETANAAGVPVEAITAIEAEITQDDNTVAAISAALAALTRR